MIRENVRAQLRVLVKRILPSKDLLSVTILIAVIVDSI